MAVEFSRCPSSDSRCRGRLVPVLNEQGKIESWSANTGVCCAVCREPAKSTMYAEEKNRDFTLPVHTAFDQSLRRVVAELISFKSQGRTGLVVIEDIKSKDIQELIVLLDNQRRDTKRFTDRFYYMRGAGFYEASLMKLSAQLTYWREVLFRCEA